MSRITTKGWIAIGVVAVLFIVWLSGTGGGGGDLSEPTNTSPPVHAADPDPGPSSSGGSVRILANGSVCDQAAGEARIYVYFTLRNTTSETQSVDVMARRRYSDGSSNDSVIDTMTAEIGANQTKRFRGPGFDYDAEDHLLIECYLHFAGETDEVQVEVG